MGLPLTQIEFPARAGLHVALNNDINKNIGTIKICQETEAATEIEA
jgi:hypothetical protein